MRYWYKEKLRRTLIDMHIEEWNKDFMVKFDPEEYFKALKIAHVNAPMIYVQSHVGLCYWPTKSGKMHEAFIGRENSMRRLFDMCHDAGMSIVAYYSHIYNNWAYNEHPEWRMLDISGVSSREKGGRYGLLCPNNLEYRQFIATQIKEFCDYFEFEGVFFDMTFWPEVCYCDSCKERWNKEVGGELPTVINWKDTKWLKFNEKRHVWLGEFAQFTTNEVKKYKPKCSVEHQYGNSLDFWRFGNNENISMASDYIGTDLYGGLEQQSFACKAWYNLTQNKPFQYMTSRCYPSLKEHTTTKTIDQLKLCVMLTYLHHGACLLIDAIDPVGTIDMRVYQLFGEIFCEAEQYDRYLSRGEMIYDVGVYLDLNGKMNIDLNDIPMESDKANNRSKPHVEAVLQVANVLRRNHIPYGVINSWKLEQIKKLKILVVSDVPDMKPEAINAIRKFVKKGGGLYLSGHTAPNLVEEVFGVSWDGLMEETVSYMSPVGGIDIMRGEFTKEYPMPVFDRAVKLSGKPKGEVLATITVPYTVPAEPMMFPTDYRGGPVALSGLHKSQTRFASIHSDPPGKNTGLPALIKRKYGKGVIIWSALPFEKAERLQHSNIFASIIRSLMGSSQFQFLSDAPGVVEFVMFDDTHKNLKIMGVINLQESFNILPIYDFTVSIKAQQEPREVFMLSDHRAIDYQYNEGWVTIHFKKLRLYEMVGFQF